MNMGLFEKFTDYVTNMQDSTMSGALYSYDEYLSDDYSVSRAEDALGRELRELKQNWERARERGQRDRIPDLISKILACKYYLVVKCKWPVWCADQLEDEINWRQIGKKSCGSIEDAVDRAVEDEYIKLQNYTKDELLNLEPTKNHYLLIAAMVALVHDHDMDYRVANNKMRDLVIDDYYNADGISVMGDGMLSELSKGRFYNGNNIANNFATVEELLQEEDSDSNTTSSNTSSSGSSGCYITSAVCESFGKPDDCFELRTFREFRDNYLQSCADGNTLIKEYYETAPKVVERIDKQENSKQIYLEIWNKYLKYCLDYIVQGKNELCKELYCKMVRELQVHYL